jgi:hypothetical protein
MIGSFYIRPAQGRPICLVFASNLDKIANTEACFSQLNNKDMCSEAHASLE